METNTNCPELMAALVKAQGEMSNPLKSNTAEAGKYSYQYADLATILDLVRPILAKHDLGIMHIMDSGDRPVLVCRVFHQGGGYLDSRFPMPPAVTGPQDMGSWLTYMRRYSLMGVLAIAGEEDDDAKLAQQADKDAEAMKRQAAREKLAETARKAAEAKKAPAGTRTSAHDGRVLEPGESPLPKNPKPEPETTPAEGKDDQDEQIDERLAPLLAKSKITIGQLRAYAVKMRHLPAEADMGNLNDGFVTAYKSNWTKVVQGIKGKG